MAAIHWDVAVVISCLYLYLLYLVLLIKRLCTFNPPSLPPHTVHPRTGLNTPRNASNPSHTSNDTICHDIQKHGFVRLIRAQMIYVDFWRKIFSSPHHFQPPSHLYCKITWIVTSGTRW